MRRYALALLLAAAAPCGASTAIVGELAPQEARAIVSIAGRVDALWNARRAAEISSLYAPDASLETVGRGNGVQGRDRILDWFARTFEGLEPKLRHRSDVDRLTVLTPDLVVADGRAAIERDGADGRSEAVRRFATTTVLERGPDGWRIRMVRTHALAPDAAHLAGG